MVANYNFVILILYSVFCSNAYYRVLPMLNKPINENKMVLVLV